MMKHIFLLFIIFYLSSLFGQKISLIYQIPLKSISEDLQSPVSLEIHPLEYILIGDDRLHAVVALDAKSGKIAYTSASSSRTPMINPIAISSNPLYTLILDADNQTIHRYDNRLRPVSELSEEILFSFSNGNRIIYLQVDSQHNIYLLEENELHIIKIDPDGKLLDTFGGKRSASLEFQEIYKFQPLGKNGFVTYDFYLKQLIGFTIFGEQLFSLPFPKNVVDFSGNYQDNWLLLTESGLIFWGKKNKLLGKESVAIPQKEEIIEIAIHPSKLQFWILTIKNIYKFEIIE
ncbi:MAG: hypothetical protein Kow00108_10260 [Calditrichia bacterium]